MRTGSSGYLRILTVGALGAAMLCQVDGLKRSQISTSSLVSDVQQGWQWVDDNGDSYVTIRVQVGSQELKTIPDSGSFELYIVDGDGCSSGYCRRAYKPSASPHSFQPTTFVGRSIYFGSGSCEVKLSYDDVYVISETGATGGHSGAQREPDMTPIWRIVGMDSDLESVWGDGSQFQGIIGLGFKAKSHASRDPGEDLREQKAMSEFRAARHVDAPPGEKASSSIFTDQFALCLPNRRDSSKLDISAVTSVAVSDSVPREPSLLQYTVSGKERGILWWGPGVPSSLSVDTRNQAGITLPVVGSRHWTVKLNEISVGFAGSASSSKILYGPDSRLAALIDSGTSLLALPRDMIDRILSETTVGNLNADCSNLNEMPDLVFGVMDANGTPRRVSLSPETYVMKVGVSAMEKAFSQYTSSDSPSTSTGRLKLAGKKILDIKAPPKQLVMNLHERSESASIAASSKTYCTHAFMESPLESAELDGIEHGMIILGIPIFREYAVSFNRAVGQMFLHPHQLDAPCASFATSSLVTARGSFAEIAEASASERRTTGFNLQKLPPINSLIFPRAFDQREPLAL